MDTFSYVSAHLMLSCDACAAKRFQDIIRLPWLEICGIQIAQVSSHYLIKSALPLEYFIMTYYKTAARIRIMLPNHLLINLMIWLENAIFGKTWINFIDAYGPGNQLNKSTSSIKGEYISIYLKPWIISTTKEKEVTTLQ